MRESSLNITGRKLFEEFSKLDREINELYDAAEMVKEEIGASSAAYRLLNNQYNEKKAELQRKGNQTYSYKVFEIDDLGFDDVRIKGGNR